MNTYFVWYSELIALTKALCEVTTEEAGRILNNKASLIDGCWEAGMEAEHTAELVTGIVA